MTERDAISLALRFRVFARDHFACRYCGARPPVATLELDHIVPIIKGGETTERNLVTACDRCNGGKGARALPESPARAAWIAAFEDVLLESDHYADYWGTDDWATGVGMLEDLVDDFDLAPP